MKIIDEKWHALTEDAVCRELSTSRDGLTDEEAQQRLTQYGINALPVKKPPTLWGILLHQILNPLIFILIAATAASVAIGEITDAVFILLVIVLNSGLGAYQEYNAEKSAAGLQKLLKINARVQRSGVQTEIPAENLVPGDIVFLESGNKVPADLRLLDASGLTADESFLTGESLAATKNAGVLLESLGVAERANMAFAGATITSGRAMGVVAATGMATEVGKIAENITLSESAKPPLVLRMERFTRQISVLVLGLSAVLAGILWKQGLAPAEIFFFVVALSVSAIPEGLPVELLQNVHVFNCRSETVSTFRVPLARNWILILGVLLAQGIHIAAMHIPFMQMVLHIEPITFGEWTQVLILAVPLLIVMEIFKLIRTSGIIRGA